MKESLITKRKYSHLLRYDQECFDGIMYGNIDLFFMISGSTLHILKIDLHNKSEKEMDFPLKETCEAVQPILEDFLIDFLSYRWNFYGEPVYVSSELITKESFERILKKAGDLMHEKYISAIQLYSGNDLVRYCKSVGLNPQPEGSSLTNWEANCPSGGHHHIMISVRSNEWGCGYCRKKGDLSSLKEWYERSNIAH